MVSLLLNSDVTDMALGGTAAELTTASTEVVASSRRGIATGIAGRGGVTSEIPPIVSALVR